MTPEDAAAEVAADRGLPAPALVRAGMNHTYRAGNEVLRVSTSEFQVPLHGISEGLHSAGVRHAAPTGPTVRFPELEVTTWRWVDPAAPTIDFAALGASVRRLHDLDRETFAPVEPLTSCTTFAHLDLEPALRSLAAGLDADALAALEHEVAAISEWRSRVGAAPSVVCHGDVHWNNVIAPDVLIDWDMLCTAPPCWDHVALISGTRRWGLDASAYDAFADGYGVDARGDDLTELLIRLRDLAATIMIGVRSQLRSELTHEFEQRLRFWRGEPNPPVWTAR